MGVNGRGRRKCCICGSFFPADLIYTIDAKNYCHNCGEDIKAKREKEIRKNKELNDYLYMLANQDKDLMPFFCKQVKSMKDENQWKAESILAVLKYIFEIMEDTPTFDPEFGIRGLVEAFYYPAKKYYEQVFALRKTPEELIQEILLMPPKEITMRRSDIIKRDEHFLEKKKNLTYGPELDMDDIEDDEEEDEELPIH